MSERKVKHIIDRQYQMEQELLSQFERGQYTPENPLIKLNPYDICPLTALIMFRLETAGRVSIRVKGKYDGTDITHDFPSAKEHILPVYGLYAGYENTVEIVLENGTSNIVKIVTEPYRFNEAHRAIMSRTEKGYLDNYLMFMMGQLNSKWVAYDRMGEVRWYTTESFAFAMKRLRNGNLLVGSSRFMSNPYMTTGVMEITLYGKILKEYRIPGGYHHDHLEMENGNLLILTQMPEASTKEDVCVLVDRNTGMIKKTWDFKNVLPQDVASSGHASAYDWFHNNAIDYDKKTNSLILSGRHQSAIISIGFDDGRLNWILGSPEGWPQEIVNKYLFTPVGDVENFEWPSEQHSAVVTPDGDIMCFDNGNYRSKDPDKFLKNIDNYSRGVRYRIDTEKMEIEQVWQYGKERGAEFFSGYISNVDYLGENHYLIHSGGIAYFDGEVSELLGSRMGRGPKKQFGKLISITVVEKEGKIVYESIVPANIYRAVKMKPYTDQEKVTFGKGRVLGELGSSKTKEMPNLFCESAEKILDKLEDLPSEFCLSVKEEIDRYDISGCFYEGDEVSFIIIGQNKTLCYGLSTKKAPLTMKEVVISANDGREYFWRYINKEQCHLGGKLYVSVNGVIYNTDIRM